MGSACRRVRVHAGDGPVSALLAPSLARPRERSHGMTAQTPLLETPTGKPRARALGVPFAGIAGPKNALTDVPGVEVGYATLIEGDDVRTGVTAIHPRGRANAGDPCAAG